MGVIQALFGQLFAGNRNVIRETAEVFRVNAEAKSQRDAAYSTAALAQFAAEFSHPRKGIFDRFIDGLNRVPRPAMAIGVIGLMGAALWDPIWFASRMQGIALVPEPRWWLLGAIVSFYFGARSQTKSAEFQASIAATVANAPVVARNIGNLRALDTGEGEDPKPPSENPALTDWRRGDDG